MTEQTGRPRSASETGDDGARPVDLVVVLAAMQNTIEELTAANVAQLERLESVERRMDLLERRTGTDNHRGTR